MSSVEPYIRSSWSPRPTAAVLLGSLVAAVLAGCAGGVATSGPASTERPPQPSNASPDPTVTPAPEFTAEPAVEELDPRCERQFPGTATVLHEAELELRPPLWPEVPDWAVLCATEWENATTQVAWYATDPGISRAEIYRHYEHGMLGIGVYGRAETAEGEISTGVFPPDQSYYILATRDRYRITWSIDGQYAD